MTAPKIVRYPNVRHPCPGRKISWHRFSRSRSLFAKVSTRLDSALCYAPMKSGLFKSLTIPLAIIIGVSSHNWLYAAAPSLKYLIAVMLFLTFTKLELHWRIFRPLHGALLIAQFTIAFAAWFAMRPFGDGLAMAAFMAAVTPTAVAAPVITGMLGGEIGFATAAVMVSNLTVAAIVPLLLPVLAGPAIFHAGTQSTWLRLLEVITVIGVPLLAAQLLRRFAEPATRQIARFHSVSFFLWATVLAIVCAKSAHFLLDAQQQVPLGTVGVIVAVTALLCAVSFTTGRLLGGHRFRLEAGQALGQKNTAFTIWMSLAFLNPLVALGPTFYVLWHNSFNSWQLWRRHKRDFSDN